MSSSSDLAALRDPSLVRKSPEDTLRILRLIRAYKARGHLLATTEPLGLNLLDPFLAPFKHGDAAVRDLHYSFFGFREDDLDCVYYVGGELPCGPNATVNPGAETLLRVGAGELETHNKDTYTRTPTALLANSSAKP